MTAGGYILCSIVLLFIFGIQVLTLKEKKMRRRLLISGGTVLIITIGVLALIDVYRDKKKRNALPMVNGTAPLHPLSPLVINPERDLDLPVNAENA